MQLNGLVRQKTVDTKNQGRQRNKGGDGYSLGQRKVE